MQQATIDPLTGPPVQGVDALLDSFGLTSLSELSAVIASYAPMGVWIPPLSAQDQLPHSLRVNVADRPLYLPFPFTIDRMWNEIDDLTAEVDTQRQIHTFWTRIH